MYIADAVLHKYPETIFGLMRVTGLDKGTDVSAWAALCEQETANFRAQWSGYDRKNAVQRSPLSCYVLSWSHFFGQVEAVFKLGFAPVQPKAVARWLRATPSICRGCKQRDNADYQAALANRPK